MSFRQKIAKLPSSGRAYWETYLLDKYPLPEAERVLEYLVDAKIWFPRIFGALDATCVDRKIVFDTEAASALADIGADVDAAFVQGLLVTHGDLVGLRHHYHHELQACCVSRKADQERWQKVAWQNLDRSRLLRRADLVEYLGLEAIARHWVLLRVFQSILLRAGIDGIGNVRNPDQLNNATELRTERYYADDSTDLYYTWYADPSVDLRSDRDVYLWSRPYAHRLANALVNWLGNHHRSFISFNELGPVVADMWSIPTTPEDDRPLQDRLRGASCRMEDLGALLRRGPLSSFAISFPGEDLHGRYLLEGTGLKPVPGGYLVEVGATS
jgi:hypothetical protein